MLIEERKEYLLQATIIEARHLKGKDNGMSNPFVKLTCMDQPPQTTEVIKESLTPCWNQTFTFQGLMLNETELQQSELRLEVFSHNNFFSNSLIGKFSIGLSTLYKNANHEYFNVWLVLSNPDEDPDETQGYLLISCFVIGPGDRPPVHDQNENVNQDVAEEDEENIDNMNFEQLREYQEKKQSIIVLGKPGVARKAFQLSVYVFKSEFLESFGSVFGKYNPSAFISARAVGLVQKTKRVKDNPSPTYNQKMLFPAYLPFLNDKILMRIWNENTGSDEFIANIPEFPMQNDFFNISKLMSMGGRMAAKWINLYSVPAWERNSSFGKKKKHPKEGTHFMGRVLLSFSLLPSEHPKVATLPCNPFYEPDTQPYRVFCDIYELKYIKEEDYDIKVWCECRIGPYTVENKKKKPKKKKDQYFIEWDKKDKTNEQAMQQIFIENFPKDLSQVPHFFLNMYTGDDSKIAERLGFIRLSPEDVIKWEPVPRWLHFRPLDMNKDSPGSILVNLQFKIETENTIRVFKQKSIYKEFNLQFYIVQGFELDPKNSDEDYETHVKILLDKSEDSTDPVEGRFPFYNSYKTIKKIELDEKLDFAPDIVVIIYKKVKKSIFSDEKYEEIGRFTVPVRTCRNINKKLPHYFNIIKSNEINGRVMCMFFIEPFIKGQETTNNNFTTLKSHLDKKILTDVKIFSLGLRNLEFRPDFNNVDFEVILYVNNKKKLHCKEFDVKDNLGKKNFIEKLEKINDSNSKENIINILEPYNFPDIEIYGEAKYFQVFPYVRILFRQNNWIFSKEELYLFFNLCDYCKDVSEHEKKKYRVLFETHLGQTTLDQNQIFLEEFESPEKKKINPLDDEFDPTEESIKINQIKESESLLPDNNAAPATFDHDAVNRKNVKDISKYKNMEISSEIKIECFNKHKEEEKIIKKSLRKQTLAKIRDLQRKELTDSSDIDLLLNLQEKLRRYKKPQMSEPMFHNFDDIADEYDYGRDIIKDDVYELHSDLQIPYITKKLSMIPKSLFSEVHQTAGGYVKLGKETETLLKFHIQVLFKNSSAPSTSLVPAKKENQTRTNNNIEQKISDKEFQELLKHYNIFNDHFITKIRNLYFSKKVKKDENLNTKKDIVLPFTNVRVRVYIYRCMNLTAQDNNANLIDRLAGYAAFSKADSYLEIRIGNNDNSDSQGVKRISDRSAYVANTLSPDFYKYFELQADLPNEWQLTIDVKSKIEGALSDTLIGSTTIDLEDRYLGEERNRTLLQIKSYEADLEKRVEDLRKDSENQETDEINELKNKLITLQIKEEELRPKQIPVEYRPLYKSGTKTAQGIIEMFVEIFPQKMAKYMKAAKIERPPPQEYELRLVIWETRNVPLGKKVKYI